MKCKFSGDQSDSVCLACNGESFELDGKTYQSIECGGFEPMSAVAEPEDKSETTADSDLTPPHKEEEPTQVNTLPLQENPVTEAANGSEAYCSKAKVTKLCYSSGITVEINGTYYKFNVSEEWEIPEDANIEMERKRLWETLNDEVDNQVSEVRNL